jgi:tRNA(His) 5'-end guanylyltransferase
MVEKPSIDEKLLKKERFMSENEGKSLSLGDHMKIHEQAAERYLVRRVPLLLRLDGNCFHSWTHGLERPFDNNLRLCMEYAAYSVCKEISGARFAYTQSDEISILVIDYQDFNTEPWFNYRGNKVESVAASMCTAGFNTVALKYLPEHVKRKGFAFFDARAFNVPKEDVSNYFLWRQRDCEKNSVSSLAQAHFSHKELHGKNGNEMQDMLMLQKSINWNDVRTRYKRGTALYKIQIVSPNPMDPAGPEVIRNKWVADYEMPIITQDRLYVERWLAADPVPQVMPGNYVTFETITI